MEIANGLLNQINSIEYSYTKKITTFATRLNEEVLKPDKICVNCILPFPNSIID